MKGGAGEHINLGYWEDDTVKEEERREVRAEDSEEVRVEVTEENVQLQRNLGLFSGISIIIGRL